MTNFSTENLLLADHHVFWVMHMWTCAFFFPHTFSKSMIKYARLIAFPQLICQQGYTFLFCLAETKRKDFSYLVYFQRHFHFPAVACSQPNCSSASIFLAHSCISIATRKLSIIVSIEICLEIRDRKYKQVEQI